MILQQLDTLTAAAKLFQAGSRSLTMSEGERMLCLWHGEEGLACHSLDRNRCKSLFCIAGWEVCNRQVWQV